MTPSEIDALPAGRELDAMVATFVMGCKVIVDGGKPYCDCDDRGHFTRDANDVYADLPCYSTDIAAAWQVVEKLKGAAVEWFFHIDIPKPSVTDEWRAIFTPATRYSWAKTAPLAICRAALVAVTA